MFGFKGVGLGDVKFISSMTKKFSLGPKELSQLQKDHEAGVPQNEIIAKLLKVPEGQDPQAFLESKLTPAELTRLKEIIATLTNGKGIK